jgi:hypothetical protein
MHHNEIGNFRRQWKGLNNVPFIFRGNFEQVNPIAAVRSTMPSVEASFMELLQRLYEMVRL